MSRRALFKAVMHIGEFKVPVELYSAVRAERVHFRLLHKKDRNPLTRRMYCSAEHEPVGPRERAKGFEVAKGQYVVLDPQEVKRAQLETRHVIAVKQFVKEHEIDPRMYDHTYYLGPNGTKTAYATLQRALDDTGRVGVCRWAMRGRSYTGVVKARNKVLLLVTLRHHHEVIPADEIDVKRSKIKRNELTTAMALIEQMRDSFEPGAYQNEYQQDLMYYIEQKARGKKPRKGRPKRKKPTKPTELQAKLERSLRKRGGGKG